MNKKIPFLLWILVFFLLPLTVLAQKTNREQEISFQPEAKFYGVGSWNPDSLGNHRAVVNVLAATDAVWAHIPWRRRDYHPEHKNIIVIEASTGTRIKNVCRVAVNREFGDLVFQPQKPGTYYIYYLPYTTTGSKNYPKVSYQKPTQTASQAWLTKNGLTRESLLKEVGLKLPRAQFITFQAIDEFNSFYPMEIIATSDEVNTLLQKHADASYLLFLEDRAHPIRMTDDLPYKWIQEGARKSFTGEAARGEFYAFQIGLYAVKSAIQDIEIRFDDLKSKDGELSIPASELRCFNIGGIDWTGKTFKKVVSVAKGKVQPLWFGVQIPENIVPQQYEGKVSITPMGMKTQTIRIILNISNEVLADAGDSEPWRHSRLRWLDSKIALDDSIVPPYIPMQVKDHSVSCLGRTVKVAKIGFPASIQSLFSPEMTHLVAEGREILTSPIRLVIESGAHKPLAWEAEKVQFVKQKEGAVAWESQSQAGGFHLRCSAQMEFDGNIDFRVTLTAAESTQVQDIRLEIPLKKDVAKYMMGMGVKGGRRPAQFQWQWDVKHNQDAVWLGDVNAGLQCSFKDENYSRPLNTNFYHSRPLNMPPSWYNEGKGGFQFKETDKNTVLLTAYSGSRTIAKGEELHFNFSLLLTPFKVIDTDAQWRTRFYHRFKPLAEIARTGANTINVHHATDINPYINYPFLRPQEMKKYVDAAHERGFKVKIYYTVRELSNKAPELFALRSLGDEILSHGPGGGFSWLQEHLDQNYIAGWFVPRLQDAAIINSGVSRWHNYYLEGLNWLVKNVGIDGLYIDDVAFDRTVMKRVRKILHRGRKGALIDLHSANQFNVRDGFANSANLYLEHFPYLNRLWFGEYFDYNAPPDYWLIEISGIPFGLMGEMLQDGGNPWRGMIYGMTSRLPWAGDPRPIWKVWDDFGMQGSRMMGYWAPTCPVKTDHKDVLATAYVKKDKTLISLASWAKEPVMCQLTLDWKTLGLDPQKAILVAPALSNFQEKQSFAIQDKIPIAPARGWLLIVKEKDL